MVRKVQTPFPLSAIIFGFTEIATRRKQASLSKDVRDDVNSDVEDDTDSRSFGIARRNPTGDVTMTSFAPPRDDEAGVGEMCGSVDARHVESGTAVTFDGRTSTTESAVSSDSKTEALDYDKPIPVCLRTLGVISKRNAWQRLSHC